MKLAERKLDVSTTEPACHRVGICELHLTNEKQ